MLHTPAHKAQMNTQDYTNMMRAVAEIRYRAFLENRSLTDDEISELNEIESKLHAYETK